MKKKILKLLIAALSIATMTCALFACKSNGEESSPNSGIENQLPESKITLNKTTATMDLYDALTLTPTLENLTGEVEWTTSDATKATIVNGVVTALAEGEVMITATIGEKSASCKVSIMSSGQIPVLSLNEESISLTQDQEFSIVPTLTFKGKALNASFDYKIANSQIATVEGGKIKALASGDTTLTVMAEYLGFQTAKTVALHITKNVALELSENYVVLGTVDTDSYDVTKTLTAMVYENNVAVASPSIVWASENEEIVTVSEGVISAVGAGETGVTAKYTFEGEDFIVNVKVNVEKPIFNGILRNPLVSLGEDKSETVALNFFGIDESNQNIVGLYNQTNGNSEMAFAVEGTDVRGRSILC